MSAAGLPYALAQTQQQAADAGVELGRRPHAVIRDKHPVYGVVHLTENGT